MVSPSSDLRDRVAHELAEHDAPIRFDVRGLPQAQGSTRAYIAGGRAITVSKSRGGPLAAWRNAVATEARAAMGDRPLITGPVRVILSFSWPRPASHFGKRGLLPSAPAFKASAPDVDKAARAGLDALTSVVIADDRLVVELLATKAWSDTPGVKVVVQPLDEVLDAD